MAQQKEVRISGFAAHLTTVVSVTLVLVLAGVITLVSLGAEKETRRLREKIEIDIVMADSVSNAFGKEIAERVASYPFARDVTFISKEEALQSWHEATGEDLEELFGVNPLSPEISFTIKADYASEDSLAMVDATIERLPGVEEVAMPDSEMVGSMNRNIETFAIILGAIALMMLIISFILINNTVHLAIYARRFTIHTMQLVGATNGFIRRPIVLGNMTAGIVAGFLASGILAIGLAAAPGAGFDDLPSYISWGLYACVAGGLVVVGAALCSVAAAIATTRYLSKDYEDLFK